MAQLTMQEIDQLSDRMREVCDGRMTKIDAIKIVRQGFDFQLKESKNYVDAYWPDRLVNKFRDDMLRISGFSGQIGVKVYEDPSFRLEAKDPTATYEDLVRFLNAAWERMHRGVG